MLGLTANRAMSALLGASLSMVAVGYAAPTAAFASPPPPAVDDCSSLRVADFSQLGNGEAPTKVMFGTVRRGVEITPAQAAQNAKRSMAMGAPIPDDITTLPDHCQVEGYIAPHIRFEIRLPEPDVWNGRFLLSACDGFCGKVSQDATMAGISRQYATMTTDGGHWGEHPFDAIWAMDNMQARIDFGYRANHVLLLAATAIIEDYYGREQDYSYLTGCSKGGQAGVMSAQRYPDDYDGIIARGPTIDYTRVNILRCGGTARTVYDDEGRVLLDASRTPLIQRAVMDYCDGTDGLVDRLISDPRKCDFDPIMIQCGQPGVGASCLTQTEADTLRELYAPITDNAGNQIYSGVAMGSEMAWPRWALPTEDGERVYTWRAASEYLKYFAFRRSPGPFYDWMTFDWDRDNHLLADLSPVFDATNPDLRAFRDSGAKMIVIHGWGDAAIPANSSIEWYDSVTQFMGGRDEVVDFARLFLLPGVNHCNSRGVGPSHYDALAALEAWVERDEAPDMLLTSKIFDGEVERTRPVYPYPVEPRYNGSGSIDVAENFSPHDPRTESRR